MRKWLAASLRWVLLLVAQVLSFLSKLPDEVAPELAPRLGLSEAATKRLLGILLAAVPGLVAIFGPALLQQLRRLLRAFYSDAEVDFTSRLWPEEPPLQVNSDSAIRSARKHFRDHCKAKFDAVRSLRADSEEAMLPQTFRAYATVSDFADGILAQERELETETIPPALQERPGGLPPLAECAWEPVAGTTVAIVGNAGAGKSFALLHQLHTHLAPRATDRPGRTVLPIYLDLAEWKNLYLAEGGHELERWVYKFVLRDYRAAFTSEEVIWLLHRQNPTGLQVVLCLDGLDELREEDQAGCLEAIYDYADRGGHVVFTCRRQEMLTLVKPLIARKRKPKCWVFELAELATEAECEAALLHLKAGNPRYHRAFTEEFRAAGLYHSLNTPLLLSLYLEVLNEQPDFDPGVLLASPETEDHTRFIERLWAEYEHVQYRLYQKQGRHFWRTDFWPTLRAGLYYVAVRAGSNSFRLDTIQPYAWLSGPEGEQAGAARRGPSPLQWYYLASRLVVGLLLALAAGCLLAQPTTFWGDGLLIGTLTAWFTWRRNYPAANAPPQRQWQALPPALGRGVRWLQARAQPHRYTLQVLGFVALLMLACGVYEGFKVPRRPDDMELWGTFSVTQAIFGMTTGLLAGTVLGFRHTHTPGTDIDLVERPAFRWLAALRTGLVLGWGGLGSVMGLVGAGLMLSFPHTTLGKWLAAALSTWRQHLHQWLPLPPAFISALSVFAVAFVVGGAVGAVLVTLLAVLDRQQSLLQQQEAQADAQVAPRSVAQAAAYAAGRGLLVAVLVLGLLGSLVAASGGPYGPRLGRFGLMATGAGLVAFLWFGGVEFVQHYTLRVELTLLRMLPLQFRGWVRAARKLNFVQARAGAAIKFQHDTLSKYFQRSPGSVAASVLAAGLAQPPTLTLPPPTARAWEGLRRYLVPAVLLLLGLSLLRRFSPVWPTATFWPHPNALDPRPAPGLRVLNDSTVELLRAAQVTIIVRGQVNVGDIVGPVGPHGTAYGFLGIALGHAFDRFPTANHGALFYRVHRPAGATAWQPLAPVAGPGSLKAGPHWHVTLPEVLHSHERLQFAVNDAEWQNNSGSFTLTFITRGPSQAALRP